MRPQSTLPLLDDFSPVPDLAVVEGRCAEHQDAYPTRVTLIVEVADTSAPLDRGRKPELYAAAGVPEYWVVSIAERVVIVHREPASTGYGLIRRLTAADMLLPSVQEQLGAALLPAAEVLPR